MGFSPSFGCTGYRYKYSSAEGRSVVVGQDPALDRPRGGEADLPTYEKIYVSNLRSRLGLERAKYVIFQAWAFLRLRVIAFCAGERVNPFNCGCKTMTMKGVHSHQLASYLDEFMWRERYGRTNEEAFNSILRDISLQYVV